MAAATSAKQKVLSTSTALAGQKITDFWQKIAGRFFVRADESQIAGSLQWTDKFPLNDIGFRERQLLGTLSGSYLQSFPLLTVVFG